MGEPAEADTVELNSMTEPRESGDESDEGTTPEFEVEDADELEVEDADIVDGGDVDDGGGGVEGEVEGLHLGADCRGRDNDVSARCSSKNSMMLVARRPSPSELPISWHAPLLCKRELRRPRRVEAGQLRRESSQSSLRRGRQEGDGDEQAVSVLTRRRLFPKWEQPTPLRWRG